MTKVKRSWDLLTDEQRTEHIQEIIDFYHNERNEEIGIIAAGNILDHFLQTVGIVLYNKGVQEAIDFIEHRLDELKIDMGSLLKK